MYQNISEKITDAFYSCRGKNKLPKLPFAILCSVELWSSELSAKGKLLI
jgi:hypothetical protein